jgi:hypothetical protein
VNTNTVTLNPSVRGTVSYDAMTQTVTFTPSAPLDPGVTYTVTFSRNIRDMRDNHLANNVTWSFTTETGPTPAVRVYLRLIETHDEADFREP